MGTVVVAEKEVEEGAEEKEDEAVKKKSKKDDENNNNASSSSDENLVLLATATIAGGIVALNGGPEESLEKIQGFMLSFWNGLIGNHAPGVGGYIEDVYLATLFFWHRVRALEIFGGAETDREPDSEKIENFSVNFARVFWRWCVSGRVVCGGFREGV